MAHLCVAESACLVGGQYAFANNFHITKADYNECGPSFVHTRSFKE